MPNNPMANDELEVRVTKIMPMQIFNEDRRLVKLSPLLFAGEVVGAVVLVSAEVSDPLFDILRLVDGDDAETESAGANATPATPVWLALGVPFNGGSIIAARVKLELGKSSAWVCQGETRQGSYSSMT